MTHIQRPHTPVSISTATFVGKQVSTIYKRKYVKKVANGIQRIEQAVLGPTYVGKRVFRGKQWECDR